jgi:hypothetical protein
LADLFNFESFNKEERSFHHKEAAAEEAEDIGDEAKVEEDESPFLEDHKSQNYNDPSNRQPGLDEGLHLLPPVILKHFRQQAKHEVKTALNAEAHKEVPYSRHSETARQQHHHVPH